MEEESSSPKQAQLQPPPHPGLESQAELSFVALNLGDAEISDGQLLHAGPDGGPVDRSSLRGGQVKIRIKSFSRSKPNPDSVGEEENESEQEHEHEIEETELNLNLTEEEDHHRDITPLLTNENDTEEEEPNVATAPPSTPHRYSLGKKDSYEVLIDNPKDVVAGQGTTEVDDQTSANSDEESLKRENTHSTLIEKECVVQEVFIVWEYISRFIIEKLLEGFAVRIPGLGTFTQSILPSDIIKKPGGKFLLRKNRKFPVFKICPHLREMYRLNEENYFYKCNVPTIPLNTSVIASNTKLKAGIVDGIIIETLQSFVTGIITNKNMEFPFPFIGKLYIKKRNVFMIFYQRFCEALSFEFQYAPSYTSAVYPGNMTPLAYHRPSNSYNSVFHFGDVRSVDDHIIARPRPYANGKFVQGPTASGDPCEFMKNLFNQSNLLYDCSCCKNENVGPKQSSSKESFGPSGVPCGYTKNLDRIKKACCTQHGVFEFQKPDGSTFSPQPLFKSSKTGNPILDRLADDRCLLQQAIGCWMKRKIVDTLGIDVTAKHYDRGYFQRVRKQRTLGGHPRKSYLVKEQRHSTSTGKDASSLPSSAHRKSFGSNTSKVSPLVMSSDEEENKEEEEECRDGEVEVEETVVEDKKKSFTHKKSAYTFQDVEDAGEENQQKRQHSSHEQEHNLDSLDIIEPYQEDE